MADRRNSESRRSRDRRVDERRVEERVPSEAGVRFLRAGTDSAIPLAGELAEVSACGLRLALEQPVSPGEKLLVEVRDRDGKCFSLQAAVVWTEAGGDGDRWLVGCELSAELSNRHFTLLREMVAADSSPPRGSA
ncbi:MAG: PilZ domain-containing protein [Planctomycetaceae bacterium]